MTDRDLASAQAHQDQFKAYVQQTAGSGTSTADEINKLAQLRASGVLTDAEFEAQKARILT
jgi:hypothetical protein